MHECGEDAVEGLRSTGIIRRHGGFDFQFLSTEYMVLEGRFPFDS